MALRNIEGYKKPAKTQRASYFTMPKAELVELKAAGDRKASAELNRRKANRVVKAAHKASL